VQRVAFDGGSSFEQGLPITPSWQVLGPAAFVDQRLSGRVEASGGRHWRERRRFRSCFFLVRQCRGQVALAAVDKRGVGAVIEAPPPAWSMKG
jgi:hypothetical protein